MTVKEFLILSQVASNPEEVKAQIEKLPKPESVFKMSVPETLNDICISKLIELQSIFDVSGILFTPCKVLLGLSQDKVLLCDADKVLGFSNWVAKEVEHINKLFAATNVKPTPEERSAGIDNLEFGFFGMIDWYALRMGITDHEEVESVPWVRVYKCLDMDAKKIRYERRLREIYQNKK